jgi:hypothetical protein
MERLAALAIVPISRLQTPSHPVLRAPRRCESNAVAGRDQLGACACGDSPVLEAAYSAAVVAWRAWHGLNRRIAGCE